MTIARTLIRITPRVFLYLLAAASLSCGGDARESGPNGEILVSFWHGMGFRGHQEILIRFADEYNATHPGVRVEPIFQGTYGTLYQKLIASITSRHPPVLAQMYEGWTTRLYARGRIDPVENHINGPNGYTAEERDDFFATFLEDNRWEGKLVTMPFNKSAHVLVYNADLLRRAGYEGPPRTWEELREIATAVSRLENHEGRPHVGMVVRPQLESFTTLFFSAGGRFLDARLRPLMLSATAERTLEYLHDLIHVDGAARIETEYPANVFGSGLVGMYIYSSASFPFNEISVKGKFEWAAAPVPAPEDVGRGNRKTLFQGMNVGILSDHPPEVRAAAWDFLKFVFEPSRVAEWSTQTGYCPIRRSALELPEMQEYLSDHPSFQVLIDEVEHAAFEPKPDFWESWRADVGSEIVTAIQGIKTPAEALAAAQRDGEDALRYDSKFPNLH